MSDATIIDHSTITKFHQYIADGHKGINGFYRFNWNEIEGNLRRNVKAPVMLLESYSSTMSRNSNKTANFKVRNISFLLLDYTGAPDAYNKQEEVLARLELVADDICSFLDKCRQTPGHWMYGLFDAGTFRAEKVGPIFDNMYGWNVLYDVTAKNPLCFNPDNWVW